MSRKSIGRGWPGNSEIAVMNLRSLEAQFVYFRPGGDSRERDLLPEQDRGGERGEDCHQVPEGGHQARPDWRRHSIRGTAQLPRTVHAVPGTVTY
jgi:hypothetical protein